MEHVFCGNFIIRKTGLSFQRFRSFISKVKNVTRFFFMNIGERWSFGDHQLQRYMISYLVYLQKILIDILLETL